MSGKDKNRKNDLPDFLRYREKQMSDRERNAFERELQKDPFAEEAAEGYEEIKPSEAEKDLKALRKNLKSRISRRQRFIYYRIAASIAVLMIISSIFIVVEIKKSPNQLSQEVIQPSVIEIPESKPISEPVEVIRETSPPTPPHPDESRVDRIEAPVDKSEDRSVKALSDRRLRPAGIKIPDSTIIHQARDRNLYITEDHIVEPAVMLAKGEVPTKGKLTGRVLSSEDNLPVPSANILIKGTKKGVITDAEGRFSITIPDTGQQTLIANFIGMESKEFVAKADTEVQVSLDPSVLSLDEVVVVGYGGRKTAADSEDELPAFTQPHPVNGKASFNRYIQDNIKRPDTTTVGQRVVVVVNFLVRSNGKIDSIKIVRSPSKNFSEEAIRLIKKGPAWKPAEENGIKIDEDVRVRIVFK